MATKTTNITNIYGGRHEPIRDPRFPTVKQWLDREAATNLKHRQPVGFTVLSDKLDITEAVKAGFEISEKESRMLENMGNIVADARERRLLNGDRSTPPLREKPSHP